MALYNGLNVADTTPTGAAGAAIDGNFRKLSERAPSLTPKDFGAVGDDVTDDGDALNAFFAACAATDYGVVNIAGTYMTTQPIEYTAAAQCKTKAFIGNFVLRGTGTNQCLFKIRNWSYGYFQSMVLFGPGSVSSYASKTYDVGLWLDASQRCTFGTIRAEMLAYAGVLAGIGNCSANDYGNIRVNDCGSGARSLGTWYGLATDWSNPVNTGTSGSVNQRTTINVTVLPPDPVIEGDYGVALGNFPCMIRIADRIYYIYAADPIAGTIDVFPWVDSTAVPGAADYVYGGGLVLTGVDSNVVRFGMLDCLRCGVGLSAGSLYGPQGNRLITQFCGTAHCVGRSPSNAALGGKINGAYFEANVEDILWLNRTAGTNAYNVVDGDYALTLSKSYIPSAPRLTDNSISNAFQAISSGRFTYHGRIYEPEKLARNGSDNQPAVGPSITRPGQSWCIAADSVTVTPSLDDDINRLTGIDSLRLTVIGSAADGTPSGTITIAAQSGWTVNGGATADFSGFTNGPAEIILHYQFATLDIKACVIN